MKSAECSC